MPPSEPTQTSVLRISDEKTLQLVVSYGQEPCLWNTSLESYKSKEARAAAAERVARILDIPHFHAKHVMVKFKNLRNSYCQELKKMVASLEAGLTGDQVYRPKVFWFHHMDSYLRPYLQPTRTKMLMRTVKWPERITVPEEKILEAKKLMEEGKSLRLAAAFVGINEATLRKRLLLKREPDLGSFKPTFTKDEEMEFAWLCRAMDERFYGITTNDLRRLAYEYAEVNKIEHDFDKCSRMAGRHWVDNFLKRNEQFVVRLLTPNSYAEAIGLHRRQVKIFYANLKDLYDKHKFRPHRIYNMDEICLRTVPENAENTPVVVARQTAKVVENKVVSAERGITVTAVMCMSVAGHFVPPALIFPYEKPKTDLLDGGPTESICLLSKTGLIDTTLFVNWLHHFKDFVNPSEADPVLLILDNDSSHISIEGLNYAREHHIITLTIPPHSNHKIQPLDVIHGPLKSEYSIECEKWIRGHPDSSITEYQVAGVFNNAYKHVATLQNAESGFRATGISPYNEDIFDVTDFAPPKVTDRNPYDPNETLVWLCPPNENIVSAEGNQNLAQKEILSDSIAPKNNQSTASTSTRTNIINHETRNKHSSDKDKTSANTSTLENRQIDDITIKGETIKDITIKEEEDQLTDLAPTPPPAPVASCRTVQVKEENEDYNYSTHEDWICLTNPEEVLMREGPGDQDTPSSDDDDEKPLAKRQRVESGHSSVDADPGSVSSLLQTIAASLQQQARAHDDHFETFGRYVASVLRAMPPARALELQPKLVALITAGLALGSDDGAVTQSDGS